MERWCFAKHLQGTTSDGFTRKNVSKGFFEFFEVFYYKGFLQMCSKFTVELPHGNISLETQLSSNAAQRGSLHSSVLGKSMCINEQTVLNNAREN